jgi:hypothetical protein
VGAVFPNQQRQWKPGWLGTEGGVDIPTMNSSLCNHSIYIPKLSRIVIYSLISKIEKSAKKIESSWVACLEPNPKFG